MQKCTIGKDAANKIMVLWRILQAQYSGTPHIETQFLQKPNSSQFSHNHHFNFFCVLSHDRLLSRGVTRSDGARDKKQDLRLHVRT